MKEKLLKAMEEARHEVKAHLEASSPSAIIEYQTEWHRANTVFNIIKLIFLKLEEGTENKPKIEEVIEKARRKIVALETFIDTCAVPYRRRALADDGSIGKKFDDGLQKLNRVAQETANWYSEAKNLL